MADGQTSVNNEFYNSLGDVWLYGQDHPIALLRAEAKLKTPWVISKLKSNIGFTGRVLDLGCGGGLLSNALAQAAYDVFGIDISSSSLEVARKSDLSKTVKYSLGDATHLSFEDEFFDGVCCMDVLEHVDDFRAVISESARVLRPGGVFLFHTFNKTWAAKLLAIKCLSIFKNAPQNLHVFSKFITPKQLDLACGESGIKVVEWVGIKPALRFSHVFKILTSGEVPEDLTFELTSSLQVGFMGVGVKQ
jgi:2-polyprenyl-6-hydroxyphenyl methylase/3-demethylubiquinone-9 3-methyltransferase